MLLDHLTSSRAECAASARASLASFAAMRSPPERPIGQKVQPPEAVGHNTGQYYRVLQGGPQNHKIHRVIGCYLAQQADADRREDHRRDDTCKRETEDHHKHKNHRKAQGCKGNWFTSHHKTRADKVHVEMNMCTGLHVPDHTPYPVPLEAVFAGLATEGHFYE